MEAPTPDTRVFRPSTKLLVAIGFIFGLLATMGIVNGLKDGDWSFLGIVSVPGVILFALAKSIRLEVSPHGVALRSAIGSRSLDFDQVSRAYIEVLNQRKVQSCATLCLVPKQGWLLRIYLRRFPIEAAATLFAALEARGIPIEIPDGRPESVAKQVAAHAVSANKVRSPN